MDLQSYGAIAGEKGLMVKRPKKERTQTLFVCVFMLTVCMYGVIIVLFVRKLSLLGTILSLAILIILGGVIARYGMNEIWEQTYYISPKGITRLRYGKRWVHFKWDSFVAIEKHVVYREYTYSREEYEAIICSTHPIELKVQSNGERYLTFNYHGQKKNQLSVVELVLAQDQYSEFLSYIPKEIQKSGIVKI